MKKRARLGPFSDVAILLFQPAFNLIGTVLGFPLLQCLVITAFGFDHFASVRILIRLKLARFAFACCLNGRLAACAALWV